MLGDYPRAAAYCAARRQKIGPGNYNARRVLEIPLPRTTPPINLQSFDSLDANNSTNSAVENEGHSNNHTNVLITIDHSDNLVLNNYTNVSDDIGNANSTTENEGHSNNQLDVLAVIDYLESHVFNNVPDGIANTIDALQNKASDQINTVATVSSSSFDNSGSPVFIKQTGVPDGIGSMIGTLQDETSNQVDTATDHSDTQDFNNQTGVPVGNANTIGALQNEANGQVDLEVINVYDRQNNVVAINDKEEDVVVVDMKMEYNDEDVASFMETLSNIMNEDDEVILISEPSVPMPTPIIEEVMKREGDVFSGSIPFNKSVSTFNWKMQFQWLFRNDI